MLEGMRPPSKKTACGVSKGAELLSKEDYKVLVEALENPAWSHEALASELTKRGFTVGKDLIRKHRGGLCNCAK
jgi:hypothetical protein